LAYQSHAAYQLCSPLQQPWRSKATLLDSYARRSCSIATQLDSYDQQPTCSTDMLDSSAQKAHCSTAMLDSSAQKPSCSTAMLDSSTLAGFCSYTHIASAIALTYSVTINQNCLFDNCPMRQPTAFCLHDSHNNATNRQNKRRHATDSLFRQPMVQQIVQ
jgi:hypothetical protein